MAHIKILTFILQYILIKYQGINKQNQLKNEFYFTLVYFKNLNDRILLISTLQLFTLYDVSLKFLHLLA